MVTYFDRYTISKFRICSSFIPNECNSEKYHKGVVQYFTSWFFLRRTDEFVDVYPSRWRLEFFCLLFVLGLIHTYVCMYM